MCAQFDPLLLICLSAVNLKRKEEVNRWLTVDQTRGETEFLLGAL